MLPSGLDSMQVKSAKLADSSTSDSDYGWQEASAVHSHQLFVQSQQQHAAIAAFRPEWPGLSYKRRQGDSTASAAYYACSSATDVQSFVAALSEHIESTQPHHNPSNSVELPFPGMHTVELSPEYAQPAVYEAVQQLTQHRGKYLQAITCCPLSKGEMKHAMTAADGYTYDFASICKWDHDHFGIVRSSILSSAVQKPTA
ncbi:MAG: hypothetical protein FRX49_08886 [Trebouxia sp. A1-2]|nr:MAG: hypothetical protein FRX49_08886 [Trebouxia sp. A1-2]